ncbi:MAG: MFS transporter, partial [bacterium]
ATVVLAGAWAIPRFGPRTCAKTGGVLFGGGWLLASLGGTSIAPTILGIGLVAGFGAGLAYLVPITVSIRWFPEHRGLVTGIAVAGFGGGAALVSYLGSHLMAAHGKSPFDVFALLGLAFLVLITLAGTTMREPPGSRPEPRHRLRLRTIVSDNRFRILYLAMITGLAAGFAANANLKQLYTGPDLQLGVKAVALFAVANALGRIVWGWVADRIRPSRAIQLDLVLQAAVLLAALWLVDSTTGYLAVACLTGFNYGGVLVIYAASVARIWGEEHVAQVYGLLFSANIVAAISPVLAGWCCDVTGSFDPALAGLAILLIAATMLVWRQANLLDVQ